MFIPPELRAAAEASDTIGTTEEKVQRIVMEFLKRNLTEERSDIVLDKIKEVVSKDASGVKKVAINLAFKVIDSFVPDAIIKGIGAGLEAASRSIGTRIRGRTTG